MFFKIYTFYKNHIKYKYEGISKESHTQKIIIMQYIGLDLVSRTILKRNVDFQTADKTSFQSVSVFNKWGNFQMVTHSDLPEQWTFFIKKK